MKVEIWKMIPGYEGLYMVSNLGRVKSLDYQNTGVEQLKKIRKLKNGRLAVTLSKNGKYKPFRVHRLVALAFIPVPKKYDGIPVEKLEVHHKDFNPRNNRVDNLEWLTKKEHLQKHRMKPVLQCDLKGETVKIWESLSEINRQCGYDISLVSRVCSDDPKYKKYKTAYGSRWRYASL